MHFSTDASLVTSISRTCNDFEFFRASSRNAAAAAELRELARKNSKSLHVLEMDVTSDASVEKCIGEVLRQGGRIDALVNNAGFGYGGLTETFTMPQMQKIFDTDRKSKR